MRTISVGKWRGLQQCSTTRGAIAILALDHRQNLRKLLSPDAPNTVPDADLTTFKRQVVSAVACQATAVLLDPEFGAAQCVFSGVLPGQIGLAIAADETGYTGDSRARLSCVLPGWSVAKAKRMGASAIKLLVYYHPDAPTARQIEELVRQMADDCREQDIPFFLEPLSYSLDSAPKPLLAQERRRVVIETARRLTPLGGDVLKAEFPIDVASENDTRVWREACTEMSSASNIPWVLLSGSATFDLYLEQASVACQMGASGVAAGRAVWQEAVRMNSDARMAFLRETARARMERLTALCAALARSWMDAYTAPQLSADWYQHYAGLARSLKPAI